MSHLVIRITREADEDYRLTTERNGNAWGVGVPFRKRVAALGVASAISSAYKIGRGDATVTIIDETEEGR